MEGDVVRVTCLSCGRVIPAGNGSYCRRVGCDPRRRDDREAELNTVAYRRLRAEVRRGEHGPCVVCGTAGSERNPLTVGHVVARVAGGSVSDGWRVECRSCNSREGGRMGAQRAQERRGGGGIGRVLANSQGAGPGYLRCRCWCERKDVAVPAEDVRDGITRRCGHSECAPPAQDRGRG